MKRDGNGGEWRCEYGHGSVEMHAEMEMWRWKRGDGNVEIEMWRQECGNENVKMKTWRQDCINGDAEMEAVIKLDRQDGEILETYTWRRTKVNMDIK